MLDFSLLVYHGLIYGVVLSLVLTKVSAIAGTIALDIFVDNYPPEIRQKYGRMSLRAARLRPYIATLLFTTILANTLLAWDARLKLV